MKIEKLCPVSDKMINSWIPRFNAIITTLLLLVYFYTLNYYIIFFLAVDFSFRGFDRSEYSPVAWISRILVKIFPLKGKMENAGPKFFAARVGWLFTIIVLLFTALNLHMGAQIAAGILTFFAFLEASIGFCMACYIYPHLLRIYGGDRIQKNDIFKKMEL